MKLLKIRSGGHSSVQSMITVWTSNIEQSINLLWIRVHFYSGSGNNGLRSFEKLWNLEQRRPCSLTEDSERFDQTLGTESMFGSDTRNRVYACDKSRRTESMFVISHSEQCLCLWSSPTLCLENIFVIGYWEEGQCCDQKQGTESTFAIRQWEKSLCL